jgi:hypothetical protein
LSLEVYDKGFPAVKTGEFPDLIVDLQAESFFSAPGDAPGASQAMSFFLLARFKHGSFLLGSSNMVKLARSKYRSLDSYVPLSWYEHSRRSRE